MKLVGTGVVILNPEFTEVLLMKKICNSSHNGKWIMPGGKVEPDETISDCFVREVKEETNLDIADFGEKHYVERVKKPDGIKYILFYGAGVVLSNSAPLNNTEPAKCAELRWFKITDLPTESPDYNLIVATLHFSGVIK